MSKQYIINVLTINGKCQEFKFNSNMTISEIKTIIINNHQSYTQNTSSELKLLYKGIELEDTKQLSNYKISDGDKIQIINRQTSTPINIAKSLPSYSALECYAPSPMDSYKEKYSRSYNSPNLDNNLLKLLTNLDNKLDRILEKLDKY
jgi:hypothetical protein